MREESVFLAGNSLGGYLAVQAVASMERQARRIQGIVLLNATPFWGWVPSKSQNELVHDLIPWKGELPIPGFARALALTWYNTLRSAETLEWLLDLVTSNPAGVGQQLPKRIEVMAQHPAGGSAFAQILFSPQSDLSFNEALGTAAGRVPVLLLYGREDPWVIPYWANKALQAAPKADYFQVSPSGHCPHFDTPKAVNEVMVRWLHEQTQIEVEHCKPLPKAEHASFQVQEMDGRIIQISRRGIADPFRDDAIAWDEVPGWLENALTQLNPFVR